MSGYVQSNQNTLVPNVPAYTVSAADTGKIFITPQTAGGVAKLFGDRKEPRASPRTPNAV